MKKFIFYQTMATGLYHASVKIKLEPGAKYKKIPVPTPEGFLIHLVLDSVIVSGRKRFICEKSNAGDMTTKKRIAPPPSALFRQICLSETALMTSFFAQAIEIPE